MKVNWDDDIPNEYGNIKLMATKPPTSSSWDSQPLTPPLFFRGFIPLNRATDLAEPGRSPHGPRGCEGLALGFLVRDPAVDRW